jgi:hypothetical protein
MNRAHLARIAFALLAIAFFITPIAARGLGITAEAFENRTFAEAPKLSQGWDAFQQATRFLIDRMPLRAQAVRANTRIWTDIFDTDPRYNQDDATASDRALPFARTSERTDDDVRFAAGGDPIGAATAESGRGGWLFIDSEFEHACANRPPNDVVLRRWAKIVGAIRDSGRAAVMLVPPSKSSVYPEYLPDEHPYDHCALRGKERFWRLLSDEGPKRGIFELRSELVRLKANAGDGLFQRKDSHWSTLGALTLVKAALEHVGDGVRMRPSDIAYRGEVSYLGDLAVVAGRSDRDLRAEYGIDRSPGAPRVPGRTLLICDSFAGEWLRLFKPYFEDVEMHVLTGNAVPETVAAIKRSDTVILESVETLFRRSDAARLAREMEWYW